MRPFHIRPELFVPSCCQFSRNSFSPLGIQVTHILAINPFAFICRRIRARNIEIPVLHEVVVGVAAVRPSPRRKAHVAVRHQSTEFVIRRGSCLNQFDAFFKIPGRPRLRSAKTQPDDDQRKQSSRDRRQEAHNCARVPQTTHPQHSPSSSPTTGSDCGFLRASSALCCSIATAARFFFPANSRHF